MTTEEYFKKLAELEHLVVVANANGDKELAKQRWNEMIAFQEKEWPRI